MSIDSSYKLYNGESPSMVSNYINYFLENEYNCSLPREISSDTLLYLRRYLITRYPISGGNLVQESWGVVDVNKLVVDKDGYTFTALLNPNHTLYVSYMRGTAAEEVYVSPDNLATCNIIIHLDKYKRYVSTEVFGLDTAGENYSGTLMTLNQTPPKYSAVSYTFEYKKQEYDVEGSEETYLLEVDDRGNGYVDRRILQYLLGYAITENSSCNDIVDLQNILYQLGDPVSDPYNIYQFTSKFTRSKYDNYMKKAIQSLQERQGIPTSGYYDRDTEKEVQSLLVDRKLKIDVERSRMMINE